MNDLLETIRISLASDATPDARRAGAAACRQILAGLEVATAQAQPPPLNAQAIASVVAALRGVPPEQLLDLAIAKLRSALPADATVAQTRPIKFHIVPIQGQRP